MKLASGRRIGIVSRIYNPRTLVNGIMTHGRFLPRIALNLAEPGADMDEEQWMTPREARRLAAALVRIADATERHAKRANERRRAGQASPRLPFEVEEGET